MTRPRLSKPQASDPLENPEVLALLRELDDVVTSNPLTLYNNPDLPERLHAKQLAFHESKTRIKVYTGGTRAGKSSAGAVDDLIQCLSRSLVPEHLRKYKRKDGPFKCRIVTPDLLRTLTGIQGVLQEWCPRQALKGGTWADAYKKYDKILHFENGSTIDFMSYEADLDKFGSVSLDRVHFDEEPPGEKGEQIYKQSLRRVVDRQGDILLTATPEFGLSWTAAQFWEQRGDEVAPGVWQSDWLTIVRASTHDNPHVPEDALSESQMTEWEYRTKVLGEWFHPKGMVYDEFEDRHIVEKPEKDHVKGLEIVVGIDPGYRTTAVVFAGFDKNNGALVFDELYLHEDAALPKNVSEQIRMKCSQWGIEPQWYYIDPMATNASLVGSGENIEGAYFREGIPVIKANNKVEAGVLEVKRRFQVKDYPALLIANTCEKLLWELARYRLDDREDGSFAVVKVNDHACDALRYLLMGRVWWQPRGPEKPKLPSYGERPGWEPPFREQTFIESVPPLGTYS